MSVANLEAYALSEGITKSYTAMTQAEQATLRYNYLMYTTADAQGDFAKTSDSFANQLRIAKNEISNLASSVGKVLLPAVNKGLTALRGYIGDLNDAFDEGGFEGLAEALGEVLAQMITDIAEQAPMFIEAAISIIQNLIDGLTQNSEMIAQSVATVVTQLVNAFFTMMPQLILLGINLLIGLMQGITQQTPGMIQTMINGIILLIDGIIAQLPLFIQAAIDIVFALIDGLLEHLPDLVIAGIDLMLALALGLIDAIPKIIEKVPQIIDKLVATLTNPTNLAKMIQASLVLMIELAKGLVLAIVEVVKSVPTIVKSIYDNFVTFITQTDWIGLGKNIITGILEGLKSVPGKIWDTVKSVGNSIMDGMKDFFGIKSPSRKMKDEVGAMLSQGIGVGFEDDIDSTYKDMEATLNAENAKLTTNVQTGGIYNNIANTVPVNVNNTTTSVLQVDSRVLAEVTNETNDDLNLQYGY